jgi:hypothetical protein
MAITLEEQIRILLEKVRHLTIELSVEEQETEIMQIQAELKQLKEKVQGLEYQEDREDDLEYQYQKEEEQDQAEEANQELKEQHDETREAVDRGVQSVASPKPIPTESLTPEQLLALKKTMESSKQTNFAAKNIEQTVQEFETELRGIHEQVQFKSQGGKDLGALMNIKGEDSSAFIKAESGSFEKISEDPSLLAENNVLMRFAPSVLSMGGRSVSNDDREEYDNASSLYNTPTCRPTGT